MINVDEIFNGFVLDHIQAGRSMAIYHYLNLDVHYTDYLMLLSLYRSQYYSWYY